MGATPTFDLYLDDLGPRRTDMRAMRRNDGLDAFAFGGFLCRAEDSYSIAERVNAFSRRFGLTAPLHSTEIRCRTGNFKWLKDADTATVTGFMTDLTDLLCDLPVHCLVAAVDRPGYIARFSERHGPQRWSHLCRSAYPILLERAAKFADHQGRRLQVFLEECGKLEDRQIRGYHAKLLMEGQEFNQTTSGKYQPISAADMTRIVLRKPSFIKKHNPLAQLADLLLYPCVKGAYDPNYPPYQALASARKMASDTSDFAAAMCCSKYYCF